MLPHASLAEGGLISLWGWERLTGATPNDTGGNETRHEEGSGGHFSSCHGRTAEVARWLFGTLLTWSHPCHLLCPRCKCVGRSPACPAPPAPPQYTALQDEPSLLCSCSTFNSALLKMGSRSCVQVLGQGLINGRNHIPVLPTASQERIRLPHNSPIAVVLAHLPTAEPPRSVSSA